MSASLSMDILFIDCVIALLEVNITEDLRLFSSPNNFLITSGNSSPVLTNVSNRKSFFATLLITFNGSAPSCLPALSIPSTVVSAISFKACSFDIFGVFNVLIADSLKSLFAFTTFVKTQFTALSFIFLSG